MNQLNVPAGYNVVNPFIFTNKAQNLISFLEAVFDAEEDTSGRTVDSDGLLLHSEILIGNSRIFIVDSKPNWPFTPGFMQIYVDDVSKVLKEAHSHGATIITEPTDFYGDIFSRFLDPWNNLWWVYQHITNHESAFVNEETVSTDYSWEPTKELNYIHTTILSVMEHLAKVRK